MKWASILIGAGVLAPQAGFTQEVPDKLREALTELLEMYPTDPQNGGPYVMWKAHLTLS